MPALVFWRILSRRVPASTVALLALSLACSPAHSNLFIPSPYDVYQQGQVLTYLSGLQSNGATDYHYQLYDPTGTSGSEAHLYVTDDHLTLASQAQADGFVQPTPGQGAQASIWSLVSFKTDTPTDFTLNYSTQDSYAGSVLLTITEIKLYTSTQTLLNTGFGSGAVNFSAVPGVYYTLEARHVVRVAGNQASPSGGIVRSSIITIAPTPVPEPSSAAALVAGLFGALGVFRRGTPVSKC